MIEIFLSNQYTIYADTFINSIFVEKDSRGAAVAPIAGLVSRECETK